MRKQRIFLIILPILIFSMGCASFLPSQREEVSLKKRVEALMQAKIDGRWDLVYDFYDTSFRKTTSRESFSRRTRKMLFKAYLIEEIAVLPSANEANVKVKVDILLQGFDFKGAPENQCWIKKKGDWFLKINPQKNPFK